MGEKNYSTGGTVAMITGNGFNLIGLLFQPGADLAAAGRLTPIPNGYRPARPGISDKKCRSDSAPLFAHEDHHVCSHLPPFF